MDATEPFILWDCTLARRALGRNCANLRELLDAVRTVPDAVLEHHMMRCALEDHFELYEFPNDLARWCWEALGDHVLGEQLGLIDPYRYTSMELLRNALGEVVETYLWTIEHVPWCPPGRELYWVTSQLLAYDTGERFPTPAALAEALPRLSFRSLFYHVHEARRRMAGQSDDFSAWLEQAGAEAALLAQIRAIDFYFLNLHQLRQALIEAFQPTIPVPESIRREPYATARPV